MPPPRRPGDDRRPDRRSDHRDRRAAPPRDAKSPAESGEAKAEKPSRAAARGPETGRPANARAARAARFKAEHGGDAPPVSARKPRGGKPSADRGEARPPRAITRQASDAPKARTSRPKAGDDTGAPPATERKPRAARPPRAKAEPASPAATEKRRVSGAERAANARAARAAKLRAGDSAPLPTPSERPPRAVRPSPERGEPRPIRAKAERPSRAIAAPARVKPERTPIARPKAEPATARPPREERPKRAARPSPVRPAAPTERTIPPGAPATARSPVPRPAAAARREPQRIAKLLARAGIASRREIERMIEERRIAIDGVPLDTPATIVTSLHGVTVDGQPVSAPTPARLFLFHKPSGFLTAERDPRGRPTIYDRLPQDLPRVMPVGRLDLNTEGLLLLTTDGELKRTLELPATGIPRIYRARAYGEVTQQQLEELIEGVEIDGMRYGQIDANIERRTGRNVWIEMQITEGKNREVRRVLEYLGLQVSRLIRVAYGPFVLADLAPGGVVEVRQHDLVAFRQTLK
ncbi:MAG TPA: pseudouridine synthase [Sphingomonas sp.]